MARDRFDNEFMPAVSAMRYLGISDPDELERIVVEHRVDVDIDDDGEIFAVAGGELLREALFEEHRKREGHRPDDPDVALEVQTRAQEERERAREERARKRVALEARVKARGI
mgnify:CR=1 FL=1